MCLPSPKLKFVLLCAIFALQCPSLIGQVPSRAKPRGRPRFLGLQGGWRPKVWSVWHKRATDYSGLELPQDYFASTALASSYFTRPSVINSSPRISSHCSLRRLVAYGSDTHLEA